MPILRAKEIRKLDEKERMKKLVELKSELMKLRAVVESGGSIKNTARIRELRRTIARILTIQRESELQRKSEGK